MKLQFHQNLLPPIFFVGNFIRPRAPWNPTPGRRRMVTTDPSRLYFTLRLATIPWMRGDAHPQTLLGIGGPMIVYGFDSIAPMLDNEGYLFKLLANDTGVVLFPHTTEHRDATQSGIKYADDSRGNALAAMIKPGRIEFRFHRGFSDDRVKQLAERILALPELQFASGATVTYQARTPIHGSD